MQASLSEFMVTLVSLLVACCILILFLAEDTKKKKRIEGDQIKYDMK